MGHYSSLAIKTTLKPSTPKEALDLLRFLGSDMPGVNVHLPAAPGDEAHSKFLTCPSWSRVGRDHGSHWCDGPDDRWFVLEGRADGSWYLEFRSYVNLRGSDSYDLLVQLIGQYAAAQPDEIIGFHHWENHNCWQAVTTTERTATRLIWHKGHDPLYDEEVREFLGRKVTEQSIIDFDKKNKEEDDHGCS